MENKTPFDLKRALRSRIHELSQSGALRADDLEEVEHHLKDSIAKLQSSGLSQEEAFLRATRNLGGSEMVAQEFLKVNPGRVWPSYILCFAAGAILFFVLPKICDDAARNVVRLSWLFTSNVRVLWWLASGLNWIPLAGAILAVGCWMRAGNDSWARTVAFCFHWPLLTAICLILSSMFLSRLFPFLQRNFSQLDFERLWIIHPWSPAKYFAMVTSWGQWWDGYAYEKLESCFRGAFLIFLAAWNWRRPLAQRVLARVGAPRLLWLLMGAVTVYSILNLRPLYWVDLSPGLAVVFRFHLALIMNEEFPIEKLAGLVILTCCWAPLAVSMLGLGWLIRARADSCVRVMQQILRHPLLFTFGLTVFPVISTLFFHPQFSGLSVSSRSLPQPLLAAFGWCDYDFVIAPACLSLVMLAYLAYHRLNRSARLA